MDLYIHRKNIRLSRVTLLQARLTVYTSHTYAIYVLRIHEKRWVHTHSGYLSCMLVVLHEVNTKKTKMKPGAHFIPESCINICFS